MTQHHDLAHQEIQKAYEAYTQPGGAGNADRIIIVLDLLIHRISDMNGGSKKNRVKKHALPVGGGMGFMAVVFELLRLV